MKGQPATLGCGPATAVVKVGGKTYRFDHGYCETDDVDQTKLILNLGVISTAPNNGGRPSFDMVMTTSFAHASILAFAGGRKIVSLHGFSARGAPPGAWHLHRRPDVGVMELSRRDLQGAEGVAETPARSGH